MRVWIRPASWANWRRSPLGSNGFRARLVVMARLLSGGPIEWSRGGAPRGSPTCLGGEVERRLLRLLCLDDGRRLACVACRERDGSGREHEEGLAVVVGVQVWATCRLVPRSLTAARLPPALGPEPARGLALPAGGRSAPALLRRDLVALRVGSLLERGDRDLRCRSEAGPLCLAERGAHVRVARGDLIAGVFRGRPSARVLDLLRGVEALLLGGRNAASGAGGGGRRRRRGRR